MEGLQELTTVLSKFQTVPFQTPWSANPNSSRLGFVTPTKTSIAISLSQERIKLLQTVRQIWSVHLGLQGPSEQNPIKSVTGENFCIFATYIQSHSHFAKHKTSRRPICQFFSLQFVAYRPPLVGGLAAQATNWRGPLATSKPNNRSTMQLYQATSFDTAHDGRTST